MATSMSARPKRPRRPAVWACGALAAVLALGSIVWGALRAWETRQLTGRLGEARRALDRGRYARARLDLEAVLERRPNWDEAWYLLGVCEQARRRPGAASVAFGRIAAGSKWAGWGDVRRSRIAMDRGRYAECERLLLRAARAPGPHQGEARWGLVLLWRLQGRFDDAKRCLEAGFDQMSSPVETLRRLYKLDVDPYPIEGARVGLERAGRQAPDDDRVWLARAHLAVRLGDFTAADGWIRRCLSRRPDDPAVWRARLEWAMAADRPEDVWNALEHVPAAGVSEARVLELRSWLAERRGDRAAERRALEARAALDPSDGAARARLAEIAFREGRAHDAERPRASMRVIDGVRQEYARLLASPAPEKRADELARLAERLGRHFDAERWKSLGGQGGDKGKGKGHEKARAPAVPAAPVVDPVLVQSEARSAPVLAERLADLAPPATGDSSSPRSAPRAVVRFRDVASAAGLAFVQENGGTSRDRLVPPVTGSGGVGLLDYDGDGWLDVYLVQGGAFPPDGPTAPNGDRLFRNRGDGTFEDVSTRSGIAAMPGGYGHGVAVGDYDNDGRPDLFVTRWRSYALYRNRGDGTFEDATGRAGLGGARDWPTSAAFADLDGDGDLDLYVCHYLEWDEHAKQSCVDPRDPSIYHCSPLHFKALPDHLFRNDGGRFVDATAEAEIDDRDGRGWGVLAADLDDDGLVDLFVANDMSANYWFRNRGGLRFEELGAAAGVAGNASGAYQAGMGVACGDLDGDGRPDLAVTNYYNESTTFFRNLGHGFFSDQTAAVGLARPSRYVLGFGISFLDADNDGWLDLITANGHIHDARPQFPWRMPLQLYQNDGRGTLHEMGKSAGPPFDEPRMGRGLAVGDLNNDGTPDVVVVSQNQPVALLRNETRGGHFLVFGLEGTTSHRDAVGAVVSVTCDGRKRALARTGGGSFQSAGGPLLHFGLGAAGRVDEVAVRWPSGRVDRHHGLAVDAGWLLREGDPRARPLPGYPPRGPK